MRINSISGYRIFDKINAGGSTVEKYRLIKNHKLYLLRLYDIRYMKGRYEAFKNINLLYDNKVSVPKLYEYGELGDNLHGYAIFDWIDGKSLDKMNEIERYAPPVAQELLKMHHVKIEQDMDIYDMYVCSYNRKLEKVKKLNTKLDFEIFNTYLHDNINILKKIKGNSIIHGDFDLNNILINDDKVTFIDLDVCKKDCAFSDLATSSCNMNNPNFYTLLINEYFDGNVPDDFWIIYNLYGILYCLDYIVYCDRIAGKTIMDGKNVINKFLIYNENLSSLRPSWFNEKIVRKEKTL